MEQNTINFIEFPVANADLMAESKAFYSEVFGWSFREWGSEYADTKSSGIDAGFNADPANRSGKPLAVIYTVDLEKTRDEVIGGGGKITKDIFSFPGGRRFHFKDPGGSELAVWSDK